MEFYLIIKTTINTENLYRKGKSAEHARELI